MRLEKDKSVLGEFIRRVMIRRPKLTLRALEEKSGISRSEISNIIRGLRKNPSAESLKALSKPLEVDYRYLMMLASGLTFKDVEELKEKYTVSDQGDQSIKEEADFMEEAYFLKKLKTLSYEAKTAIYYIIKIDESREKANRPVKWT